MAQELKKGLFIVFEGPDGCGKSVISNRITQELLSRGYDVRPTREPGTLDINLKRANYSPKTELLLFEADRAQHISAFIEPALKDNAIIICDRFNMSTLAYQGWGLGMDIDKVKAIDKFVVEDVKPDLVILLDVDAKVGLDRAFGSKGDLDNIEKRNLNFHEKLRKGYLALAKEDPEHVKVIDSNRDLETVYREVGEIVNAFVKRHTRAGNAR